MSDLYMIFIMVLCGFVPALFVRKVFSQRVHDLEKDLLEICSAVSQMAEMQEKSHRKFAVSMDGLEERIMELSVPSSDSSPPLERRHQVLTLARRGMALEEISKRLKAPVGEAELIIGLGKYAKTVNNGTAGNEGQVRHYV